MKSEFHITFLSGQPTLSLTGTNQQYGLISSTTFLSCAESEITWGSTFMFAKDGQPIITNFGELDAIGKYIAILRNGEIQLQIKETSVSDEGSYTCNLGFYTTESYFLQVEGRLLRKTIIHFLPDAYKIVIIYESNI